MILITEFMDLNADFDSSHDVKGLCSVVAEGSQVPTHGPATCNMRALDILHTGGAGAPPLA